MNFTRYAIDTLLHWNHVWAVGGPAKAKIFSKKTTDFSNVTLESKHVSFKQKLSYQSSSAMYYRIFIKKQTNTDEPKLKSYLSGFDEYSSSSGLLPSSNMVVSDSEFTFDAENLSLTKSGKFIVGYLQWFIICSTGIWIKYAKRLIKLKIRRISKISTGYSKIKTTLEIEGTRDSILHLNSGKIKFSGGMAWLVG